MSLSLHWRFCKKQKPHLSLKWWSPQCQWLGICPHTGGCSLKSRESRVLPSFSIPANPAQDSDHKKGYFSESRWQMNGKGKIWDAKGKFGSPIFQTLVLSISGHLLQAIPLCKWAPPRSSQQLGAVSEDVSTLDSAQPITGLWSQRKKPSSPTPLASGWWISSFLNLIKEQWITRVPCSVSSLFLMNIINSARLGILALTYCLPSPHLGMNQ